MKKYLGLLAVAAVVLICVTVAVKWLKKDTGEAGTGGLQQEPSDLQELSPEPTKGSPKYTVVLDAGHGGFDPGKVGVNGAKEKDINLSIVLKLKELLEQENIRVAMTRETDTALCEETDSNKKATDLKNRVVKIEEAGADLAVSIHQNSFTDGASHGAQVFYYGTSESGKIFAELMQETIKSKIADGNHRVAKANTSYYLLKKTSGLLIIVECGFLSNAAEADLLITEEYQQQMAEAVKEGIITYLELKEAGDT